MNKLKSILRIVMPLLFLVATTSLAQDNQQIRPQFVGSIFKLLTPQPTYEEIEEIMYFFSEIQGSIAPSGHFVFASYVPRIFANKDKPQPELAEHQYLWDLSARSEVVGLPSQTPILELHLTDDAGLALVSPDEQYVAAQYNDRLMFLSVTDFTILANIGITDFPYIVTKWDSLNNPASMVWASDSQSLAVVLEDYIFIIDVAGRVLASLNLRSFNNWIGERPYVSHQIYRLSSEYLLIEPILEPYSLIICDWLLSDCTLQGQGIVGYSLAIVPEQSQIVTTHFADNSQLLSWNWDGQNLHLVSQAHYPNADLWMMGINSTADYLLARNHGFTIFVTEYSTGSLLNSLEVDGVSDAHWLPDGQHFIVLDESINEINLTIYTVGQAQAVDKLSWMKSSNENGAEINLDYFSIAGISADGTRVLVNLGASLVVVPIIYQ